MKPRKHIHVKYCWQTYFKSIGTLSQLFGCGHCNGRLQVPSASDVFLSKNDNFPARLPRGWNMIFISQNMIFVLCDHVF